MVSSLVHTATRDVVDVVELDDDDVLDEDDEEEADEDGSVVDVEVDDPVEPPVVVDVVLLEDESHGGVDATVTGAVLLAEATATAPASALALLVYVPGVHDAVTLKCSVDDPLAGTLNGPFHVRVVPFTVGFVVVTPVVDPAT